MTVGVAERPVAADAVGRFKAVVRDTGIAEVLCCGETTDTCAMMAVRGVVCISLLD